MRIANNQEPKRFFGLQRQIKQTAFTLVAQFFLILWINPVSFVFAEDCTFSPQKIHYPRGYQGGHYKPGTPYQIENKTYIPKVDFTYDQIGLASWYGAEFKDRPTANGEIYDMCQITAAHPTLPMPSVAKVTNLSNGKSLLVRVNDRGPFIANRIIDLSYGAASALDMVDAGVVNVRVQLMPKETRHLITLHQQMQAQKDLAANTVRNLSLKNNLSLPPSHQSFQQFFVQVGAFQHQDHAQRFLRELKRIPSLSQGIQVAPAMVNRVQFYRVRIPVPDHLSPRTFLSMVAQAGYKNAFLVTDSNLLSHDKPL